jgi:hypothetical protein
VHWGFSSQPPAVVRHLPSPLCCGHRVKDSAEHSAANAAGLGNSRYASSSSGQPCTLSRIRSVTSTVRCLNQLVARQALVVVVMWRGRATMLLAIIGKESIRGSRRQRGHGPRKGRTGEGQKSKPKRSIFARIEKKAVREEDFSLPIRGGGAGHRQIHPFSKHAIIE